MAVLLASAVAAAVTRILLRDLGSLQLGTYSLMTGAAAVPLYAGLGVVEKVAEDRRTARDMSADCLVLVQNRAVASPCCWLDPLVTRWHCRWARGPCTGTG